MSGKIENLLKLTDDSNTAECSVTQATRVFAAETEAESVFRKLVKRLFHIKNWNDASEILSFTLCDSEGIAQSGKLAAAGDYIKTILPGSGKADWIKITEIFDAPDETVVTVQPANDPTDATGDAAVSHFFAADSSNNFCLQKKGARINFYVIGLNERSNVGDTDGIMETVRNLATANIGYLLGIQKTQWQTFCDNFIEMKDNE